MKTENKKVLPFGEDLPAGQAGLGGVKKYILKPGRHQFVSGSHAIHHNNNLTDEEAEWYLAKYPHIASMFEVIPKDMNNDNDTACRVSDKEMPEQSSPESVESLPQSAKSKKSQNEDLPPAN